MQEQERRALKALKWLQDDLQLADTERDRASTLHQLGRLVEAERKYVSAMLRLQRFGEVGRAVH